MGTGPIAFVVALDRHRESVLWDRDREVHRPKGVIEGDQFRGRVVASVREYRGVVGRRRLLRLIERLASGDLALRGIVRVAIDGALCPVPSIVEDSDRIEIEGVARRAMSILDVAPSGMIVCSGRAVELLMDQQCPGLRALDLGFHRLRDLGPSIALWQLVGSFPVESAPLGSLDGYRHNLPVTRSSFVGRGGVIADVSNLLDGASVVTLTGTGGVGKSRLALAVASRCLDRYPGGAWLVDLTAVSDPAAVNEVVVDTLVATGAASRVASSPGRSVAPQLLVLDNCEHVLAACAFTVASLLASSPALHVLATSRQALGVDGEVTFRVPSLTVPTSARERDARIDSYESVQLFCERVRSHDPSFQLSVDNARQVARICSRLDGIPLAVELAAARCHHFGVERLAEELDDRLHLFTHSSHAAPPRQQTLAASIEWSYSRLDSPDQVVFRRLGVFSGPFTLDLATSVASSGGDVASERAAAAIGRLVDGGLVDIDDNAPTGRRFRLLESLRIYALERASVCGELERLHEAHVSWWTQELAWETEPTPRQTALSEAMADNLKAALEHNGRDAASGLALLRNAARAWHGTNASVHAAQAAERLLTDESATRWPDQWIGAAAMAAVHYAFVRGAGSAGDLARRAGRAAEMAGDPVAIATGRWMERPGDDTAVALCDVARASGDKYLEALVLLDQAERAGEREPMTAQALLGAHTPLSTSTNVYIRCWADLVRGRVARDTGDLNQCIEIGRRLLTARSSHMIFNGVILLTQAGLLAMDGDALRSAMAAADAPNATARLVAEGEVARAHLGYLDATVSSRVDPELGIEPMTLGSLWLCACEAIDAGVTELAARAVLPGEGSHGPFAQAVRATVDALTGKSERWYDALTHAAELGLRLIVVDALEGVAVLSQSARPLDCLRLLAAADRLRAETGYRWRFPTRQRALTDAETRAVSMLSAAEVADARSRGEDLAWRDAAAYALRRRGRRRRPRFGWDSLSPTELRVAELVAAGMSNPQIARSMLISPATAKTHLDHVFVKLGVHSRAEVAGAFVSRTTTR